FVIIDPEGDYATLEGAAVLGDPTRAPLIDEVLDLLKAPGQSVVVNLLGLSLDHRPGFFDALLPRLQALRTSTGRPHWTVVAGPPHLMHPGGPRAGLTLPRQSPGLLFITVPPASMAALALETVGVVLAVGENPEQTLAAFCKSAGHPDPGIGPT